MANQQVLEWTRNPLMSVACNSRVQPRLSLPLLSLDGAQEIRRGPIGALGARCA